MGQRGSAQARRPQYPREVAVAVALGRWNEIPTAMQSPIQYNTSKRRGSGRLKPELTFYVCLYLCKYEVQRRQRNVIKLGVN